MAYDKIKEAVRACCDIVLTASDHEAELELYLDALSRHTDWTERDILELHKQLVQQLARRIRRHAQQDLPDRAAQQ